MSGKKDNSSWELCEECSICHALVPTAEAILTERCNVVCKACHEIILEADERWPSLDRPGQEQF
jgi:hypothetical protein